jgi:hypothetical protein
VSRPPTRCGRVSRDPDRSAIKDDRASLANERRPELRAGNADLLRTVFLGTLASTATLVGLAFATARLV